MVVNLPTGLDFELAIAARKLIEDVMRVRPGEEVVITADTASDWRVVEATAKATEAAGAKALVAWHATAPGVGKAVEPYVPVKALTELLKVSDVWIEFNKAWLLYSTPYEEAMRVGRTRYICLVGMDADMMVRNIGRVDVPTLYEFQRRLAKITRSCRRMRATSPAGMDVTFENDPSRPVLTEGEVSGPGEYMLFGQVDWAPVEGSIDGVIVFDGSVWPPPELGLLREPIKLRVKEGKVVKVEGGPEARVFEAWLRSFNDERMLRVAHLSYGCNPGAKLTGNILEDERVWGAIEWGLGAQSSTFQGSLGPAPSHTDGICLNPTLECLDDGTKIIENGEYVHPELRDLAQKLRIR